MPRASARSYKRDIAHESRRATCAALTLVHNTVPRRIARASRQGKHVPNPDAVVRDLRDIANYLSERRDEILTSWKCAVEADPELRMASTTTRAQFIDHIPSVLDAFESRLTSRDPNRRAQAREAERESAAEHGLHRWQQGYDLPETMCEWGHLHLCLLQELENCHAMHPDISPVAYRAARHELLQLCSDGVCASATRYTRLQQHEAATRV